MVREFIERLAAFFGKSGRENDLDAEMKAHLAFAIDENIAAGLTPAEAKRRALIASAAWKPLRNCIAKRARLFFSSI